MGATLSETDLTRSDTNSDTTIQDTDEVETASDTSSVTEMDSGRDSAVSLTTRKTLSKRKHVTSEEESDGIEDDGDSPFDDCSYEPSQVRAYAARE